MWPTRGLPLRYWPLALLAVTAGQVVAFFTVPTTDAAFDLVDPKAVQGVTMLFSHLDVPHLVSNMVSQLMLGLFVEGLHGHWRFLVLYVASGLGSAMWYRGWWCAFLRDDEGDVVEEVSTPVRYLAGCSGAVYGLMGAYTSHLLLNWAELHFKRLWFAAVLAVFLLDVGVYVLDGPLPGVAYAAHVGGGVFGACFGVLALRNVRVLAWERRLVALAAGVAIVMGGAAVLVCQV